MAFRVIILGLLALLLGVPFALVASRPEEVPPAGAARVIVYTPHVPQIREEFGRAFETWHRREFNAPAVIDWRTPGGTTEIRRALEAEFSAAIARGAVDFSTTPPSLPPGSITVDVMLGGGSYEHDLLKRGVIAAGPDGARVQVPISTPAGLDQSELDALLGENAIGAGLLYDKDQYWIGTALSSFGIVSNSLVLTELGVDAPQRFADLGDPRLVGLVALADPRQSGSVTTTLDAILGAYGWDEGWRLLRAIGGNARYFTNAATKPPADVSQGDAAAGLAIDFYGRGQAQTAGAGRVEYIDPAGETYIDADPVSIIRGGPNPELARRLVRFMLTEEAQLLWQLPPTHTPAGRENPVNAVSGQAFGPASHALRRMPVRRDLYARFGGAFVDRIAPFDVASRIANPGWRTGVEVMLGCSSIDTAQECRAAWGAIARAKADPAFPADALFAMEEAFFAFPDTPVDAEGTFTDAPSPARVLPWVKDNFRDIRNSWRPPGAQQRAEIAYTRFFKAQYRRVLELAENAGGGS
jgi:ABC-type Fe3+ transport system substrate-binding protein